MTERVIRAGGPARVALAHEPDFIIGSVRIRPARREIVGKGRQEMLEPRVMRVLVALVRAKGEILSRDDLIESCWDGLIVGEDAINRCIGRLRKAAEASGNAFTIETIARVGYRLKPEETSAPSAETTVVPESIPVLAENGAHARPTLAPNRPSWPLRRQGIGAAAVILVLVISGIGLWRLWPTPAAIPRAPEASLAVLPFVNMSGDPAKEYFSDGFSEELLNDLSNDPQLRVAARTSAFAFKGKNRDIAEIARALRVRAIIEGSVREAGNRVRVTAQLINGSDGYHLWSATYDRDLADVLSVQDDVARAIAAALTHRLVPRTPNVPHRKIDPVAYRLYLQARQQLDDHWRGGYGRALALFQQVTARQPDFAEAFAGLARAALNFANSDAARSNSDIVIANRAAEKALSLDPQNIEAREVRSGLALLAWNWHAATSDVQALLSENANSFRVLSLLRIYYREMGFANQAIAVMERARLRQLRKVRSRGQ